MTATEAERAKAIAAARRVGIALPPGCVEGVALNLRLLERHRANITTPSKQ